MGTTKVTVGLDRQLVRRVRDVDPAPAGRSDADVIERALARHLARKALDDARALGPLGSAEADQVAVEEVHAVRRARRRAA